jgi:hypothetical protein
MALKLSTGCKTGLAGTRGLKDMFDQGWIDIYSGGQPTDADAAETGSKLARITLASAPVAAAGLTFGTAALGLLPKSASVWSGTVGVAGIAGYFRLYGTNGTTGIMGSAGTAGTGIRIDGNVGVSGSDLVLSNTSLVLGATVTIDTFTLEVPGS